MKKAQFNTATVSQHEGEALRKLFKEKEISVSDFAEKVQKSRPWVYDLFKSDSLSFENKALISYYFEKPFQEVLKGNFQLINENHLNSEEKQIEYLIELQKKNEELEKTITFYQSIINTFTELLNSKTNHNLSSSSI